MQLTTEIIKLMKNLIKKFLKPKKTRATTIATPILMSEISQFVINDRLGHSDQPIIAMEIIQTVCNSKTDETDKKIVEA